jgi:hypothetical protein
MGAIHIKGVGGGVIARWSVESVREVGMAWGIFSLYSGIINFNQASRESNIVSD